jgi:hypothetical protein
MLYPVFFLLSRNICRSQRNAGNNQLTDSYNCLISRKWYDNLTSKLTFIFKLHYRFTEIRVKVDFLSLPHNLLILYNRLSIPGK